ncbi:hypothetical protein SVAN01_08893 [Stagonosporopsis vannaccii]|nr:hypothetical protein SVAN01_08893 [Stagonosporopsis vannaccii]
MDHLFDSGSYDNDNMEIDLIADDGLIDEGLDLYGQGIQDLPEELDKPARVDGPVTFDFDASVSQIADPLLSDQEYFFGDSFPLLSGLEFDGDAADLASRSGLSAPQSTPIERIDDGFDLDINRGLQLPSFVPTTAIAPAVCDGGLVFPTLAHDQEQGWQVFANEHTHLVHPKPRPAFVPLLQSQVFGCPSDPDLHTSAQLPSEQRLTRSSPTLDAHMHPLYQSSQSLPQAQDSPQRQQVLSLEQIQLLQNVVPAEHAIPPTRKRSRETAREPDSSPTSISPEDEAQPRKVSRNRHAFYPIHRASATVVALTYTSLHDAEVAMASRFIESDWRAPFPDNTLPTTQDERSEYVRMMFEAFQDTSECKDNKAGFSFLKRWDDSNYYNLQEMEKVCWHMLDIAERLHSQGPTALNIYCEDALKKVKGSRGLTFEQRIYAICDMLKFSKNLCDNLLKGEGIEGLVGAPKQKMSGAKTMMVQNQRRQKWIEHGRNEDQLRSNHSTSEHLGCDEKSTPEPTKHKGKKKFDRSGLVVNSRAKTKSGPF